MAKPPHNRKLGIMGVSLTKARPNRHDLPAMEAVQDEIESVIIDSGYLINAPFNWVTISLRYGLKDEQTPHYQKINKKYGDLPLAIEIDTHRLLDASLEQLKGIFREAVVKALVHAGEKYKLPTDHLKEILQKAEHL